jgi:type I restriction enzyme, S subunit
MPQNIGDNRIDEDGIARISKKDANRLRRHLVEFGDIVYSRRGDVERRALVREREVGWLCGTGCMKVRLGKNGPDPRFAFYCLGHPSIRAWIVRHAHGATMANLNTSILSACPFVMPPLSEQRAIAHILGTLDDKIELNRRMSATLEAMARALFKSWFVDFDPVRAKAEGRDRSLPPPLADLFPARLVDSELGATPEGWNSTTFGDTVRVSRDQENPLAAPDLDFVHFSIPAFDEGGPRVELGAEIKSLKFRVSPEAVLVSKLNPEIERVWLVDLKPEDRAVCSTEFLVLQPRSPFGRAYIYCLARSPMFRIQIESMVTGTSKSHQRAPAASILGINVVGPASPPAELFERVAGPLLARTLNLRRESRVLAALRDALLPKLISGKIRVNMTERIAERATS